MTTVETAQPRFTGQVAVFITYTMLAPIVGGVLLRALRLAAELHRRGWWVIREEQCRRHIGWLRRSPFPPTLAGDFGRERNGAQLTADLVEDLVELAAAHRRGRLRRLLTALRSSGQVPR
jgi:hypothetical protein